MSGEEGFPVRIASTRLSAAVSTARVIRGVTVGQHPTGLIAELLRRSRPETHLRSRRRHQLRRWLAYGANPRIASTSTRSKAPSSFGRLARAGEKVQLLDGSEHTLVADDLVIADEKKALGLAGVMGGMGPRALTEETKNILVEAVRGFQRRRYPGASLRVADHGFLQNTDASHRFERGCGRLQRRSRCQQSRHQLYRRSSAEAPSPAP